MIKSPKSAAAVFRSGKSVRAMSSPSIEPNGKLSASVAATSLSVLNARKRLRASIAASARAAKLQSESATEPRTLNPDPSVFIAAEQFFFRAIGLPGNSGNHSRNGQRIGGGG